MLHYTQSTYPLPNNTTEVS